VRSGPGAARTIPLFHTISARPPKQPRMVRTFLRYTRGLGWRMHCGAEVTESSTNKQHQSLCLLCVTAVPFIKLFARGIVEDSVCVYYCRT
jgi:hypothetical protein